MRGRVLVVAVALTCTSLVTMQGPATAEADRRETDQTAWVEAAADDDATSAPSGTTATSDRVATDAVDPSAAGASSGESEPRTVLSTEELVARAEVTAAEGGVGEVLTPVTDPESAPPGAVQEVLSARTDNVKVFTTDEPGIRVGQVFAAPVHVPDESGGLVDIDLSLVERDGRWVPRVPLADVGVGLRGAAGLAEPLVSVDTAGGPVGWDLVGASDVPARAVDGDPRTVVYEGLFDGVDLTLTSLVRGIKDELVLAGPESRRSFDVSLRLPVGTVASLNELGDLEVRRLVGGELVASMSRGFMYDSSAHEVTGMPAESDGVAYQLRGLGVAPVVRVTLDDAWLDDPARVWPVTVDPATVQPPIKPDDTYARYGTTTNRASLTKLEVGDNGTGRQRSFLHFDTVAFRNQEITAATLHLRLYGSGSCTSRQIVAHRLTQSWSGGSLTWANQPSNSQIVGSAAFASCPDGYKQVPLHIDDVQDWADQAWANHGMMLRAGNEDSADFFKVMFSANASIGFRPYLSVQFKAPLPPTLQDPPMVR